MPSQAIGNNNTGHADLVKALLLPRTPENIREKYLSLEKRAEQVEFGLLEQDVVILDTETTGLSFHDSELIQIAAARISGREHEDRFETFVHPQARIPPKISALTHITEHDVASAPDAQTAVARLVEFVGGQPVVAHNATFDRTFIEKVPGGHAVSDIWIDSLALSRIALPRLRTHRLSDMADAFGCAPVTHRATDDVDALANIWRILLLGLCDLPKGLLELFATMHPDVQWPYRPIFKYLSQNKQEVPFSLKVSRTTLIGDAEMSPHINVKEKDVLKPVESCEISAAFEQGGLISRVFKNYETRPEQIAMAREVADAVSTSTHRVIEAGTGIGKSIAYLLPEALFAKRNKITVGIATKTNALTDQLVSHDLPMLSESMSGGLNFVSLKGYEHYPCLFRLDQAAAASDLPVNLVYEKNKSEHTIACEMLTALAVTYAFACQSPDGDLDCLGIRWRYVPRQMLTVAPSECLRSSCPYFPEECFIFGARKRAASADVVVTNHSLLLCDVEAEGRILPPIKNWVIDEAHAFESEARRQWAKKVSAEVVHTGFETLGSTRSGVLKSLLVSSSDLEDSSLAGRLLTRESAAVSRASLSCSSLFSEIVSFGHEIVNNNFNYERTTVWIDQKLRSSETWKRVVEVGKQARRALDEAYKDAEEAAKAFTSEASTGSSELLKAAQFMMDTRDALRLILAGDDPSFVYYIELPARRKDAGSESLCAEKIDIGADLAARWLPHIQSVVFTSATIAIGKSFEHFNHMVGLDLIKSNEYKEVSLASSFDFDKNMAVIIAKDMPLPTDKSYLSSLEKLLYDVHVTMSGSVLTLFTNRHDMESVFYSLAPRLATRGLVLNCQTRGSSPRHLSESFIADNSQSLFALRSFWEGFDATGETLRCVVIPKLPFANPHDPLVCERETRDSRAWWRYSLPEAILSVKQAAGRLIRSKTDSGLLILADSRLVSRRYGKQFIAALPTSNSHLVQCENVGQFITIWRHAHEKN